MPSIVTYDISMKHADFKSEMFALGYKDQISANSCKVFPNTTLYHQTKNSVMAREDVRNICKKLEIYLERCVATQWGPDWAVICGEPFR